MWLRDPVATRRGALAAAVLLLLAGGRAAGADAAGFVLGADLSSLPRVEAAGGVLRSADGAPADAVALLRAAGFRAVRLRLWHAPADGACGLAETLAMALRARAAGCDILLDIHYSDTWADPGRQSPPAAWAGLGLAALADSVRAYTRDVVATFVARGVAPRWVQVGNEVTGGMLWEAGRLAGGDRGGGWDRLALLLQAGADGVREGAAAASAAPQVVLHLDRGCDNAGSRRWLDQAIAREVRFDAIGLSYYPWWHGSTAALAANLGDLAARYGKPLLVVETAYPWTTAWFDDTHNPVGAGAALVPELPASPAGQGDFLARVMAIVAGVPGGLGAGLFWWEPAWIAAPGHGSPWENCALFDDRGRALPALAGAAATMPAGR